MCCAEEGDERRGHLMAPHGQCELCHPTNAGGSEAAPQESPAGARPGISLWLLGSLGGVRLGVLGKTSSSFLSVLTVQNRQEIFAGTASSVPSASDQLRGKK